MKKYLRQKATENALVWEENEARKGTPAYEELERYECSDLEALKMLFVNEYDQWKDVVTLRRPLIYKEVPDTLPCRRRIAAKAPGSDRSTSPTFSVWRENQL